MPNGTINETLNPSAPVLMREGDLAPPQSFIWRFATWCCGCEVKKGTSHVQRLDATQGHATARALEQCRSNGRGMSQALGEHPYLMAISLGGVARKEVDLAEKIGTSDPTPPSP
ncbi:MAG: hypothetical protein IPH85_12405 [Ignavibacteria bacterium]|nr:hypothetical protein [Ignavibacteria bacterium]